MNIVADEARPALAWGLVFVVAAVASGAIVAGASLIVDPTGAGVGLPLSVLAGTVFADFFLPGLLLLVLVGLSGAVVAIGLVGRWWWAWPATFVYGLVVIVWIAVQVSILGLVSVLQPVVGLAALIIVWALVHPRIADFYRAREGIAHLLGTRPRWNG